MEKPWLERYLERSSFTWDLWCFVGFKHFYMDENPEGERYHYKHYNGVYDTMVCLLGYHN